MHTKFGLNQPDFEALVENQEYSVLAAKLKANLSTLRIREGDYESAMHWLEETAKMHGKSVK